MSLIVIENAREDARNTILRRYKWQTGRISEAPERERTGRKRQALR